MEVSLSRLDSERVHRIMRLSGDIDASLVVSRALANYEADLARIARLQRQARVEADVSRETVRARR